MGLCKSSMQRTDLERRFCLLQIPVERIEALLLWQDPYVSAKVFGAGLYILICLRHLVCGEAPVMLLRAHAKILSNHQDDASTCPWCGWCCLQWCAAL